MADNSRTRTTSVEFRQLVLELLSEIEGASVVEFAGNDPKEMFNYLSSLVPDDEPIVVFYHSRTVRKNEPEAMFYFSLYIVSRNIVKPEDALSESQAVADDNAVATSVYALLDHKIINSQLLFNAVGDEPRTISSGGQTTVVECQFTMEDY